MQPTIDSQPTIDLLSISSFQGNQPHDQFSWLRANSPVHFHEEPGGAGFWAVTRYDDVCQIGRDPATFSSGPSIMIEDTEQNAAFGDKVMMLMADPPLHTSMRRLVSREFTPRAAAALRERIRELASAIIDEVAADGECDLVARIAGEMPSFVIAELLGIPLDDGRDLYHHTEAIHASEEAIERSEREAAVFAIYGYAQQVFNQKRENPTDDLASLIANSTIDGKETDEIDFFLWFLLLIDAGGDTTRNLIGGGMYYLLQNPDQFDWLRSDLDARLPSAVEELLRFVSPVVYMRRTATKDTMIGDQAIAAGDKVVMYYGSANRDTSVFENAEQLDLSREENPHVAFGGGGPHFCLGAHLARIEVEEMFRAVISRLDNLSLKGEPTWSASSFVFGPAEMQVTFSA